MKIILIIASLILGTVPLGLTEIATAGTAPIKPRYVSLAPSTTEILFALGLDEEIVGVSTFCDWPPEAKNKEKIGSFSQVNIEKVLSLKPDYIFCTGLEQAGIVRELKRLKLNIYVADPTDIKELFTTIKEIGQITGKVKEAQILVNQMESGIEEVKSKVKLIPENKRQKVFIEIWYDPLTTAGKGSYVDEVITLAGGINIASDTRRAYSIFSAEEVINRNPDCIILAYMDQKKPKELVGGRFGWSRINAVKNNRLYNDIDPALLLRPGPRVVQGAREIYKRLYL
ncbi:MAG: cobalamin-binding protein [Candidatus Omnitrophica bacterium]|nr:cobalamin-binding protein [Candidatus Omnitrophota bacterium]